ncbi:MAG: DUF2330 domain-containing protein [Deltaproteobacteria bacterium]|nr:DUF2330 domain-containing protein [Deltaproteobacteria bacterium]
MNLHELRPPRLPRLPALVALAALLAPSGVRPSEACMLVSGANHRVRVEAEEALIVYDPASRTEHFIRKADFRSDGQPFGFIVPTPTRPTLAEADEAVFTRLAARYGIAPRALRARGAPGARGLPGVVVVEVQRVAGLDATVLRANDATALAAWLGARGFAHRPAITAWLGRYTTGDWHLTAFRYNGGPRSQVGSRAVRLSFTTDAPFYPYAEPSDQPQESGRRFRLTVVAPQRVEGVVGSAPWAARVGYAGNTPLGTLLRGAVPETFALAGAWMTTFEERDSRRGASDLTFRNAAAQTAVRASIQVFR